MKKSTTIAALALCGAIHLSCSNKQYGGKNDGSIFVKGHVVSTNLVRAGYYGSSSPILSLDTNGFMHNWVQRSDLVPYPPIYKTVTNLVLGYVYNGITNEFSVELK